MAGSGAWVLVRESGPTFSLVPAGVPAGSEPVTAGRSGTVPVGVHLVDEGISRIAVTLTARPSGWTIDVGNRNGAVLHPWGLAPQRALATQTVRWPLVAVRITGTRPDQQHLLLLENDEYANEDGSTEGGTVITRLSNPPPPLAPAERQMLQLTFRDFLAWPPPTTPPQAQQLKQVATRSGKSLSGVQDRLRSAMEKALRLGLPSPTTLTNPDYLHVLVAAGYLLPPRRPPFRRTVRSDQGTAVRPG
ncbi:hypothetical protein ACQEVB_00785 [Pseudonocardia sp. CA-107938]|uniref:hypothetical protein n=1 Tax=Pseudonocardia sp. CA-107938 TaxID=3240021 RepID=UPI003D8A8BF1